MLSELLRSEGDFKPVLGITAKGSAGLVDAQRVAGAALEAFELSLKVRIHGGSRILLPHGPPEDTTPGTRCREQLDRMQR